MSQAILLPNREDVLLLHDLILSTSQGRPGILHDSYIDAALERPYIRMNYEAVDIHIVVASLMDSFARSHAFNDGNKRTALIRSIYTYTINDIYLDLTDEANVDFEATVLWIVNAKPEITKIAANLRKLVEKYQQKSFDRFLSSFRDFIGLG